MMNNVMICNSADNMGMIQSKWLRWTGQVASAGWILTLWRRTTYIWVVPHR